MGGKKRQFVPRKPKHFCAYSKKRYRYDDLAKHCKKSHKLCNASRCSALMLLMDNGVM